MTKNLCIFAVGVATATAGICLYCRYKKRRRYDPKIQDKQQLLELRDQYVCKALSLSYSSVCPLYIVRGSRQYLYSEENIRYLDTRNNVGSVGWQHPTVVKAICDQTRLLNCNTRYLHHSMLQLCKELLATTGSTKYTKVFFVNSGTEANDLAFRLAVTHTRSKQVVVVEEGYHGHSYSMANISPYKFNHPNSFDKHPQKVLMLDLPCSYRGKHAASPQQYAKDAVANIAKLDKVCCFFGESGMSVGGVILPPRGYLQAVYDCVRSKGGLCVADEVQTGLARSGKHFWMFQQQGVEPDIITVGKPFGNGFPLAAVITTDAVSESFTNGVEWFSTFGGNPVACEAGLAVLRVIREENLQVNAYKVGQYFANKLWQLSRWQVQAASEIAIGDVRGAGLFLGIELIRRHPSVDKAAAAAETAYVCSRLLLDHHILTSIDGPHHNVIVIKPPLCFSFDNADYFASCLKQVMAAFDRSKLVGTIAT